MSQIQGALVGIAMVLSAVFIPMALFGGSTGAIYRQFSITIVSAMALSVLVVLILPRYAEHCSNPPQLSITKIKGGFFCGPDDLDLERYPLPTVSAKSSVPQDDIYCCQRADCCRNGGVVFTSSVFLLT
ncbi:efflux RND transporter permease subunit [Shigella flexneri]